MAPLKFVALALAVSVFGVATVSSTAIADPAPANKAAADKDRAAKQNAYLTRVMKNNGFSDAKAKGVVASITRYQKDFRRVHKDIAAAKALLRDENTANDKAAQARIDADKKQLDRYKERYKAEIGRLLTNAEQNKLAQILAPPPAKAKGKGKHKKGKPKQKTKRT